MRAPRLLLSCLLLATAAARAQPTPTGCEVLRAENAALKARVQVLEAALQAGSQPAAAVVPPATPVPPGPPVAVAPGLAPKPAVKQVLVEEEPYSRSGCRPSMFKALPHAIWMETDRWEDLAKGMSDVEVERRLGPEHYDTTGGGRVKWEYGKCGLQSKAQLLFEQGRLVDWRAPSQ